MTTTSPTPVLRLATTGAAPAGAATSSARAVSPVELAEAFAAMVEALTTELAAVSGEPLGTGEEVRPEEPATDSAEQATSPDDILAALVAAPLQVAPAPAPAPAGTAAETTGDDPVGLGAGADRQVPAATLVEGEAAAGPAEAPAAPGAATEEPDAALEGAAAEDAAPMATRPLLDADRSRGAVRLSPSAHRVETDAAPAAGAKPDPAGPAGAQVVDPPRPVATDGAAGGLTVATAGPGPAAESAPQLAAVVTPAGAPSPAAASSVGATSPAASVAPAAPAVPEQLVSLVSPLRRSPDGTHRMSLQLRPEELGEVTVDVRVLGTQISLHLRADVSATTDLLRASLADLRLELEAAGFDAGSLDVGADGREAPHGDDDRRAHRPEPAGAATSVATAALTAPTPTPAAGIDIRL